MRSHLKVVITGSLLLSALSPLQAAVSQSTYAQRAQAEVNSIASEIRQAEHKINRVKASDRDEFSETIKHLWAKEKQARNKVEEIRQAPAGQWLELRREEDSMLIHLKKSYQHLLNRYFK